MQYVLDLSYVEPLSWSTFVGTRSTYLDTFSNVVVGYVQIDILVNLSAGTHMGDIDITIVIGREDVIKSVLSTKGKNTRTILKNFPQHSF